PLAWDELAPGLDPAAFTLESVPARLAAGADPWAEMARLAQRLPDRRRRADARER
ncbi:MAG: hypothetical protein IRY94_09265, partial [Rhodospirillaceae bacterium]|nr:hypothetical protein [Rhodospirillaceae bacterium]